MMTRALRHLPPRTELVLTGLLTEPDEQAAARMAIFDALPAPVRLFLEECPFDFRATQARDVVSRRGVAGCLGAMSGSVAGERQRYARERDLALRWARDTFRNGPRPKREPPPEGWSVHNFPG
jgi:hypothetical protein